MTSTEPQEGEIKHVPLPRALKRRLGYVALMYLGLMSLLLILFWAQGSDMSRWLIVAVLPVIVGVYVSRNVTITVRVPSGASTPTAAEIDAEWEATASPFTPRLVMLLASVAVVIGGTAIIVKQSATPDSPELIEARAECSSSWADFAQDQTFTSQQSWTECLLRNPPLASACGLSAQLASAMLEAESIDDVELDSQDLMTCGADIY